MNEENGKPESSPGDDLLKDAPRAEGGPNYVSDLRGGFLSKDGTRHPACVISGQPLEGAYALGFTVIFRKKAPTSKEAVPTLYQAPAAYACRAGSIAAAIEKLCKVIARAKSGWDGTPMAVNFQWAWLPKYGDIAARPTPKLVERP